MKRADSFYRIAVKMKAKELLARNFLKTAGAVLAYVVMGLAFSYLGGQAAIRFAGDSAELYMLITSSFTLLSLIVCSPLVAGVYAYCIGLVEEKPISGWDVFSWFGDFSKLWRALVLSVCYALICFFWVFVYLLIPTALMYWAGETDNVLWLMFESLLTFAGTLGAIRRAGVYQAAFVVLAENPDRGPIPCLREAGKTLKPYRSAFFMLTASFVPWFFFSSFTFGALLIYVYPYFCLSQILFYRGCRVMAGRAPMVRFVPGQMPQIWPAPGENAPDEPPFDEEVADPDGDPAQNENDENDRFLY